MIFIIMKIYCLGFAYYSNVPCAILMETLHLLVYSKDGTTFNDLSFTCTVSLGISEVCTVRLEFYV